MVYYLHFKTLIFYVQLTLGGQGHCGVHLCPFYCNDYTVLVKNIGALLNIFICTFIFKLYAFTSVLINCGHVTT